jgi:p-cumate 2,3-dioxygenase ferredoxin component
VSNSPDASRHRLCSTADVAEGTIAEGYLPDLQRVAIYRVAGKFYVTDDLCTHGAASLIDEGTLEGYTVQCAWHSGCFDITTGAATAQPCTEPLRTYPVEVDGGALFVHLAQPGSN